MALDKPIDTKWTLRSNLDLLHEGLGMDTFILYALVLSEVVEVLYLQIVDLSFLVEDHLEVEVINIIILNKIIDFFLILLRGFIKFDGLIVLRRDIYLLKIFLLFLITTKLTYL